jgi:hypothetical protein
MLNLEISRMTSTARPVDGPHLSNEARSVHKTPRRKVHSERGSSFQSLIANGILEPHLTHSKQTMAVAPNREKFRGSALQRIAIGSYIGEWGEQKALAADRNTCQIRNQRMSLKNEDITISNRNKNSVSAAQPFRDSPIAGHSSQVTDFYRMREEISWRTR